MNRVQNAFIWPWVGPLTLNILNMGPWDGPWWVPGIAPLQHPPGPHYPGYTLPPTTAADVIHAPTAAADGGVNMVVGLKSVAQLSLSVQISGS